MLWPFGATRKHDAQSNTQKSGIVMDSQGMKLAKRRIVYAIPNLLAGRAVFVLLIPPPLLAVAPINSTAEGSFSNAGNNSVDILSKHDHGVVKTAGFWDVLRCSEMFWAFCHPLLQYQVHGHIWPYNHVKPPLTVTLDSARKLEIDLQLCFFLALLSPRSRHSSVWNSTLADWWGRSSHAFTDGSSLGTKLGAWKFQRGGWLWAISRC